VSLLEEVVLSFQTRGRTYEGILENNGGAKNYSESKRVLMNNNRKPFVHLEHVVASTRGHPLHIRVAACSCQVLWETALRTQKSGVIFFLRH